jgi:hypothetical protein
VRALARVPYALLCALLGLALGWLPQLVHGPIAEKYNVLYIEGAVAVWGWYAARLLIGVMVGITTWPRRWFVRGPLIGGLMLFPLSLVSLATPGCGARCMIVNLASAAALGTAVAGLAFAISGRHHSAAPGPIA